MRDGLRNLSEKERETLRLLGSGHEVKSIAAALDLSVHTINERLRTIRRKLEVSSSREAARMLLAEEGGNSAHNNSVSEKFGVADSTDERFTRTPVRAWWRGATAGLNMQMIGVAMIGILLAMTIFAHSSTFDAAPPKTYRQAGQPIIPIPQLFRDSDYPKEALAQKVQGTTAFQLQVRQDGTVEECNIEQSSGSPSLDQATCDVILKRSRFHPAVDKNGRPAKTTFVGAIKWIL